MAMPCLHRLKKNYSSQCRDEESNRQLRINSWIYAGYQVYLAKPLILFQLEIGLRHFKHQVSL